MIISPELQQKIGPMDQGTVTTDDGTELLYQLFGSGPAVVFANGIGVRYPGVVEQMNALRDRYQVICWDYRGIGQSVMASPDADVSMGRHARDILAILDHLEIERAIFVGWSMGVQVSLEVIGMAPGRAAGFVALLGTYARPFQTSFPTPVATAIELFFTFLNRNPALAQQALNLSVALPGVSFAVLSKLLFVGSDADREVFEANVSSVCGVDKAIYTRTMLELCRHDAEHILPTVPCPSLIVCGQRDHLTPPRVARFMADTIPDATYEEVPGGTHFAMIEQPGLINGWLVKFVERALPTDADPR